MVLSKGHHLKKVWVGPSPGVEGILVESPASQRLLPKGDRVSRNAHPNTVAALAKLFEKTRLVPDLGISPVASMHNPTSRRSLLIAEHGWDELPAGVGMSTEDQVGGIWEESLGRAECMPEFRGQG